MITKDNSITSPVLEEVVKDSYSRLIAPAIEREIRNLLTEQAEEGAIPCIWKESGAASDAAANCRTDRARLGSGIPYRLQAGSSRSYWKEYWIR